MGVFCIEVTANDESISYIFEKVNIPLIFDVMLRRTIQTYHSNVVIFCPNIQHRCLNVLCLNVDFFIVTDIIFLLSWEQKFITMFNLVHIVTCLTEGRRY
jgi:hypothetical protein